MQILGYDMRYTRKEFPSHKVCTSLAGNAFSGFAIAPIIIAMTAVIKPDSQWSRKTAGAAADEEP